MRLISSQLDRTSLVNEGFMIQQKDHRFIKNQDLFVSKDWKGSPLGWAIKTQDSPHIAHWRCKQYNKLPYTHPFHLFNLGRF